MWSHRGWQWVVTLSREMIHQPIVWNRRILMNLVPRINIICVIVKTMRRLVEMRTAAASWSYLKTLKSILGRCQTVLEPIQVPMALSPQSVYAFFPGIAMLKHKTLYYIHTKLVNHNLIAISQGLCTRRKWALSNSIFPHFTLKLPLKKQPRKGMKETGCFESPCKWKSYSSLYKQLIHWNFPIL